MGDFYNGGLWGNFSFFVGSNWNFVPGYIKNVADTHYESLSSKIQVIKKLSPNSLWQTNMKWTVADIYHRKWQGLEDWDIIAPVTLILHVHLVSQSACIIDRYALHVEQLNCEWLI